MWTVERVCMLKYLYLRGCSYTIIANALGGDLTRGAVSGKIDRISKANPINLPRRKTVQAAKMGRPIVHGGRSRQPPQTVVRKFKPLINLVVHPTVLQHALRAEIQESYKGGLPDIVRWDIPPRPKFFRLRMDELTNDRCHWVLGDVPWASPHTWYCGGTGANVRNGIPYCPLHSRFIYSRASRVRKTSVLNLEARIGSAVLAPVRPDAEGEPVDRRPPKLLAPPPSTPKLQVIHGEGKTPRPTGTGQADSTQGHEAEAGRQVCRAGAG